MSKVSKATRQHQAQQRATKRRWLNWFGLGIVLLALAGGIAMQVRQQLRVVYAPGAANWCKGTPAFVAKLGLSQQSYLSTTDSTTLGVVALDNIDTGNPTRYQHPSWDDAGYLGAIVRVRSGDIYLHPVPRVSLVDNPPAKQNMLYRLDGETQEMTPFLTLTGAAAPSESNPFGVLGLTYDCDTESLYASSVAGSTRTQALGIISQIEIASKKVVATLPNEDAMGLAVYNTTDSKRLYFGSARFPVVFSVALDRNGHFSGQPQPEIQLADFNVRADARVRRIEFLSADEAMLYVLPFTYNLAAQSERQEEILMLKLVDGKWTLTERRQN